MGSEYHYPVLSPSFLSRFLFFSFSTPSTQPCKLYEGDGMGKRAESERVLLNDQII